MPDLSSTSSPLSLTHFFPDISPEQMSQLNSLPELYREWNARINVISRKDEEQMMLHHVWHSLALALRFKPLAGQNVLDVGTGGGFPGIPMAILYPETGFTLCDSIGKKIKVVNHIAEALNLQNVQGVHARCETLDGPFDHIISRAVAPATEIMKWTRKSLLSGEGRGWWFLKGGDLSEEFRGIRVEEKTEIYQMLRQDFFKEKYVIRVPSR